MACRQTCTKHFSQKYTIPKFLIKKKIDLRTLKSNEYST